MALNDEEGNCHAFAVGPAHTTTREELDGRMARFARAAGAELRTQALYFSHRDNGNATVVEYADLARGERRVIRARNVFFATGATARLENDRTLAFLKWDDALLTCYQYRVYLQRPADAIGYRSLELHYFPAESGRQNLSWMFPKRDHLTVAFGVMGKMPGKELRAQAERFEARIRARLYPGVPYHIKEEGHLLYGGWPRPVIVCGALMVGGTAAGLVDATKGEGIFEAAMSGRLAAGAVAKHRNAPRRAAQRYNRGIKRRFYARLKHRVTLMRFLERRPRRFGVLFEQLAMTPRFAEILQREDSHLPMTDRSYLYGQALKFATNALRA